MSYIRWLVFWLISISADVRWILLEVGETDFSILKTQIKTYDVDFDQLYSQSGFARLDATTLDVFVHTNDVRYHSHRVRDPRFQHMESTGSDGEITGEIQEMQYGHTAITVPLHATHLSAHRRGKFSWQSTIPIPTEANFVRAKIVAQQQQDTATTAVTTEEREPKPIRTVINQAGDPSQHKNIVFLSGGYTAKERTKFDADVRRCAEFLQGVSDSRISAAPWHRYWPLLNVFSVFEPSEESGASFPKAVDGTGGHPESNETVTVKNNLDCKYGTSTLRFLNCAIVKMIMLGSWTEAAPEKMVAIALVNDVVYGGTGGMRFASIYTGLSMLFVLIHELGHADTDLMDEYSYGFSESKQHYLPNCAFSDNVNSLPWKHWVDQPLGVGTPSSICTYDNYYKPTPNKCLMHSQNGMELCAVCAEKTIASIYRDTDSLASPRCPKEHETMVITDANEDHWLYIKRAFFEKPVDIVDATHQDGTPLRVDDGQIITTWTIPNLKGEKRIIGTWDTPVTFVSVNGAELGISPDPLEPHKITLNILDQTKFVKLPDNDPIYKKMNYTTTFRVRVVPQSTMKYRHCTVNELMSFDAISRGDPHTWQITAQKNFLNRCNDMDEIQTTAVYCGLCDEGKDRTCNETYVIAKIDAKLDFTEKVENLEDFIFGPGGVVCLIIYVLLILIGCGVAYHFRRTVHDIIPLPPLLQTGRIMIIVFCVLTLLGCSAIAIGGFWQYTRVSAFGKAIIFVAGLFASTLVLVTVFGLVGALYRRNVFLGIYASCLSLVVVVLIVITILVFIVGNRIDSASWKESLENYWLKTVASNSRGVCSFQTAFQCSGFTWSCHRWPTSNSQCPPKCDVANVYYRNPCYVTIVDQIKKFYIPSGFGVLVVMLIIAFVAVMTWLLVFNIRKRKRLVHDRLRKTPMSITDRKQWKLSHLAAVKILKNLEPEEIKSMERQFNKMDTDGKLSPQELKLFLKKTTGEDVSITDLKAIFDELEGGTGAEGVSLHYEGKMDFQKFINSLSTAKLEEEAITRIKQDPRVQHMREERLRAWFRKYTQIPRSNATDGRIDVEGVKYFYKELHGYEPSEDDLYAALQIVDNDNNETAINFVEFLELFAGTRQADTSISIGAPALGSNSSPAHADGDLIQSAIPSKTNKVMPM